MNKTFSFTGAKKIVFGNGAFEQLAEQIGELGGKAPLIVLDRNLSVSGLKEKVSDYFKKAGMNAFIFDRVEGEPPLELADEGARAATDNKCDIIVGIGGGSTMDVAKAVAVITANKGKAKDYLGLNMIPGPGLPTIMVPTTAGTGSEVTFTSVFIRKDLNKKEGMNSPYLYPDIALLDPELTLSIPSDVTATSSANPGQPLNHSHSIVLGGFELISYTTRLIPLTSLIILEDIRPRTS